MDEKSLGRRLQEARQAYGLTQQQLCQKANLSYSTLAKIERGAIKAPSIFTIQQIASALNMTLDHLVGIPTSDHPAHKINGKTISKTGISFVYFDVNGCLVQFFHRAFSALAQKTGASADLIETTFWHFNDAVCNGKMSLDDFNAVLSSKLGIENINWRDYYLDAIDPIPEMHELVKWAAEQYHVGLLTNIMPGFIEIMKQRQLIPDIEYAAIIDSSEVGHIKPNKRIYEIAQEKAACPPTQILFVDDSRTNIMAAERLGWHVLWFDDFRPDESVSRVRAALEPA
jgi:FMN phosphatase YigB (HAD superfamily)/DNA-binding XRE family transcriptional regulator